jgi:hypothetical protein
MTVVRAAKIIAIQFAGLHVGPLPLMIFVAHCYAARFGMRCFPLWYELRCQRESIVVRYRVSICALCIGGDDFDAISESTSISYGQCNADSVRNPTKLLQSSAARALHALSAPDAIALRFAPARAARAAG